MRNLNLSLVHGGYSTDGTLVEYVVVGDEKVIEVLDGEGEGGKIEAGEWASLLTAGGTAWSALREGMDGKLDGTIGEWAGGAEGWKAKRLAGKTVLTMGTGGVSCAAIQVSLTSPDHCLL